MLIEKGKYGQYIVSDIVENVLVTKQYYGYTKKEAKKLFNEELRKKN